MTKPFEEIQKRIEKQTQIEKERSKEEWALRELLWLHHGCPQMELYGDDAELQCAANKHSPFWIDFRRDSPKLIRWKLANDEYKRMIPIPLEDVKP